MKRQTPVDLPQGYVEFFINLENLQNEMQIKLTQSYPFETYAIKQLLVTGNRPLLELKGITINTADYLAVLLNIISLMKQNRPDSLQTMEKLEQELDKLDLEQIIARLTDFSNDNYFNKLAEDIDVSLDLLVFVLDHAIRPFLRIYAAPYQQALIKEDTPFWQFPNVCPVCGSKSHFSRLRSVDSRRFMFCDRCFSEWESRLLQCVHCGNDDPETIKYSSVENDDAYQIYLCDKCHGYLKTYDEKQNKELTDLFIANIETIYLDILAQEKGYSNHND